MQLRPLSVIFVLARECLVFKPVQHLGDAFGWVRQHGLDRDTRHQNTVVLQKRDAHAWIKQQGDYEVEGRARTINRLQYRLCFFYTEAAELGCCLGDAGDEGLVAQPDSHPATQYTNEILGLNCCSGAQKDTDLVDLAGLAVLPAGKRDVY
eukprot:NODE_38_length_30618_cov_0.377142.p18 type:complete len:151 gc:universal NODE_38_length_30618_cov_0.377142:11427-11879(+)